MTKQSGVDHPPGKSIEAVDFDAPIIRGDSNTAATPVGRANPHLSTREGAPWWHSQFNLMLCVFGLLIAAAGLFIVLTPPPQTITSSVVVEPDGSTRTATPTEATESEAPWDENRRAQARTDSQEILAEMLEVKKSLEQKKVEEWASEQYAAAINRANEGDDFYKRQQFAEAIEQYQAALAEMESVLELIPQVLQSKIDAGEIAIREGKTELARTRFKEALALDTNSIAALRGVDRAKTLDEVLEIVRDAAALEQSFVRSDDLTQLQQAQQKFSQAAELDPAFEPAKIGFDRVAERLIDKQYRDAMSAGFEALFASRYRAAQSAFSTALKLKPGDPTASSAYTQSLASNTRASLSSLLATAKRHEANEEWQSAAANYAVVLQRDANQVAARLGQIRSQARADLNAQLEEILSDTLAISRATQRERAQSVLRDAKAVKDQGPVLTQQITQLESALQQADATQKVAFVSDDATEVKLSKAGASTVRLGKFTTKNLALKPGRYVVTGERLGFHDVRKEIEVRAAGTTQTVAVACSRPIASSAAVRNDS